MSKNCPGCGTPLEDDDMFCYKCGASFGAPSAAPQPAAPPPPQKAAPFAPGNTAAPMAAPVPPPPTAPAAAPPPAEPPKKSSGGKKAAAIIAIVLAVLIAGGVGLFFLLRGRDDDSSSSSKKRSTSSSGSKKTEATTDEDETEEETTEATTEATTKKTTTKPVTTAEPTTEAPTQPPKADLSTYDRPKPAEFKWFSTDLVDGKLPSGIEYLTRAEDFAGGWKGMIIVDPDKIIYDFNYTYYVNFDISGSKDDVKLVIDWYQGWPEASEIDQMDDVEDMVLTGKEWNDGIYVEGDFSIQIQEFYEKDGKQYAVGMLYNDSGVANYVAMVRP